jgi:hypothetical protein
VSFHWQGRLLNLGGYNHFNILWVIITTLIYYGANFSFSPLQLGFNQSTKGDLVNYNTDMNNPQKGIDLMNNTSIIIRILFAVTLFQHSPLTRRVFYNSIRRERGQHHQQHLGTLTGISINHRKFFSSSISSFTAERWNGIIILISQRLR